MADGPPRQHSGRPPTTDLATQVSGIFLIFVASMHRVLHWGFPCHPQLCNAFVGVYYTTAIAAVASAVFAKSALQRGLPMLGLLVIRLAALATRISLGSGSPVAVWHYIITEVRWPCPAAVHSVREHVRCQAWYIATCKAASLGEIGRRSLPGRSA